MIDDPDAPADDPATTTTGRTSGDGGSTTTGVPETEP